MSDNSSMSMADRMKMIMQTSIIAIVVNTLLAIFKVIVGMVSNSIAIMLDGINNLSDAGSSLITIVGTALAAKSADRKHPFGYGRMEYLSSLVISAIVIYAGVSSAIESIKKIINPETADYSTVTMAIIIVAVVVKLILALFMQSRGRQTRSDSLVASGKEAILDVAVSLATVMAAVIYVMTGIGLEAYLGLIIAVIIVKTGVELLLETVSKILGEPSEIQTAIDIKKAVSSFDGVYGAYDLVMNNYGPDIYTGSIHIEVDDSMTVAELDKLTRDITRKIGCEYGVFMTAVGVYAHRSEDNETSAEGQPQIEKDKLSSELCAREYIIATHGFYVDHDSKYLSIDVVVSLDAPNRRAVYNAAVEWLHETYPDYEINVGFDMDLNELKAD